MNIGVSTGCFFPRLTIDALKSVAETGVKYAEIFFNTDSELDESYVKQLKTIADENGIRIISVHPFTSAIETFMFWSKSDYKLQDSIKYYEKYGFEYTGNKEEFLDSGFYMLDYCFKA